MDKHAIVDNQVAFKAVVISGILLGLLLLLLDWVAFRLAPEATTFTRAAKTGVSLILFWVVCTSTLRSIERLRKKIPGLKLLAAGIGVAVVGVLLHQLALQTLAWLKSAWAPAPDYAMFLFYAAGGFIAAVISLINFRVRNKRLGNVLEVLFIALVAWLFFFFTK
ncbi:MAG TPA: hypothetical protein PKE06_17005 [Flavilitoribacter sp.]|nr:hypothetical protein [Flavilitoribacter sp.]HMQ89204.1 hypothetical protein [Flavilitoribacter sp.]